MANITVGTECCNNCIHWNCKSRKIVGSPPSEVETLFDREKCSISGDLTEWRDCCGMFKHIGGVKNTFKADRSSMLTPGEAYLNSVLKFAQESRQIDETYREAKCYVVNEPEEIDLDGEAERKFANAMAEVGKANKRAAELVEEGMDPEYTFDSKAIEFMHLLDQAKGGDGKAQFALARAFWDGRHGALKEDEESGYGKGWQWCNESADNGYGFAQLWKGVSWRNDAIKSNSVDDYEAAVKWLEKALYHSEVREKDREKDGAYSRALNNSRIALGIKYLNADGVDPDYEKALAYFDDVESSGDSRGAEYKKKAEELYEKVKEQFQNVMDAADDGVDVALNILGMIYAGYSKYKQMGLVVKPDKKTAFDYFTKAADAESADAMDNLGNCYKNGDGVDKDIEKAAGWYRKSAECGWLSGVYHYATCLREGEGVEKDEKEALRWYMKAGASGHGRSLNMLGSCAEKGHGMNEDPELAFEWYRLAAESGDAESMYDLGRCYHNGYGCEENESLGDEWQAKAKANGYSGGW